MNRIINILKEKLTKKEKLIKKDNESLIPQKKYDGVTIISKIKIIEDDKAIYIKPTFTEDGLLIPFAYASFMFYMLIDNNTLKDIAKLIRDYDDGK